MKLFARYNRINLVVTAVLLILSAIAYYFIVNHILVHELDEELDNYRQKIESFAQRTGGLPEPGALEDLTVEYVPDNRFYVASYLRSNQYDSEEQRIEPVRQLVYTQRAGKTLYRVIIGKPMEGIRLLTRTIVYSTLVILLIIILVSLLVNHFVLKKLWRPFYGSMNLIKNFSLQGKSPPAFPPTKTEEFSFMNDNLGRMIGNAQTDYRLLKEFTENASHEIQTPLAIIRSKLDLVIQEESLTEMQGEILDGAYTALKRISKLNQSLLLLARIENKQFEEAEQIDLEKELIEKLDQFNEFWQDNNIDITADIGPSHIWANSELVDILLNNLLANAAMHNKEGGRVIIELKNSLLTISNSGPSQPLDETRLFRRFYKASQHSHHNGLGLSIVKQICDRSGIRVNYHFSGELHVFSFAWNENGVE